MIKKMLGFPSLKSLVLTRCFLSGALIENLSLLIKNQLDELTLTFEEDAFTVHPYELRFFNTRYYKRN